MSETRELSLSPRDLALTLRALADLIGAGLPVLRAVRLLDEVAPDCVRELVPALEGSIRGGKSLASAFDESRAFPGLVVAVVRAGEAAGALPDAMSRAAEMTEERARTVATVRAAVTYPAILFGTAAISVAVLATTVLPRYAEILQGLNQSLPPLTVAVIRASTLIANGFVPMTIVAVVVVGGVSVWVGTDNGRRKWHAILLRLPIVGPVRRSMASANGMAAMAAMLQAGVAIPTALAHAAAAAGDAEIAQRVLAARQSVSRGVALHAALRQAEAVTPVVAQLVRAGEETGRLATMMYRAAAFEREYATRRVHGSVKLIEPLLILLMGAIVAAVAAGMFQALYGVRIDT